MKPKQWLFENGFIADPKQRGRLSLENKARIADAMAKGVKIDGYEPVTPKAKVTDDSTAPIEPVEVKRVDPNRIYDVPNVTRDEKAMSAYAYLNGKKVDVGMRTVCQGCGNSLTYCYCRAATVYLDHDTIGMVNFTTRKTPVSVRHW